MKCPNCGKELTEGFLYCEVCGGEVRIVPDFEPELESQIHETLTGVAEEIITNDHNDNHKNTLIYRVKHFSFYHFENFVDMKLVAHKIIQSRTSDQCLYIMNAVQQICLSVAVQL